MHFWTRASRSVIAVAVCIGLFGCSDGITRVEADDEAVRAVSQMQSVGSSEYPYYTEAAWTASGVLKFTDDVGNEWMLVRHGANLEKPSRVEFTKNGVYLGSKDLAWSGLDLTTVTTHDPGETEWVEGDWQSATVLSTSDDLDECDEGGQDDLGCCESGDGGVIDDGPGCDGGENFTFGSSSMLLSGDDCDDELDAVGEEFEDTAIAGSTALGGVAVGVAIVVYTHPAGTALKVAGVVTGGAISAGAAAPYFGELNEFFGAVLDWGQCKFFGSET